MLGIPAADSAEICRATPLDAFLARSPILAAATVVRDGAIVGSNAAFTQLLGRVASLHDVVAEGQEPLIRELLALSDATWRSVSVSLVASDGALVDCSLSALAREDEIVVVAEPLLAPADRLNRHLLELNDELIAARRELASGNRKLRELDDLKNMFITSVTHDLKTPLTSIIGYAELLREDESLDETALRMVGTIERSGKRVVAMIDDLLGAAQVMTGELRLERTDVDVIALVSDAIEAIEPSATAGGVTIELDAPASATACVDAPRVLQILDNLLSNAVKYSPHGGHVVVSCRAETEISVAVTDTGIGIPLDEQPALFGRFFRASTARDQGIPGTGLGLANARAFAEAHHGRLDCTSEVGVGSTFTLVLPRWEPD